VAILAVILAASACGTPAPSSPSASRPPVEPTSSPAASRPSDEPPSSPTSPGQQVEPTWTALQLPPPVRVASLEATERGTAGVAPGTRLRLTSLSGEAPAALARRLEVEPAVELRAAPPEGDGVLLRPATPLEPGRTYRLRLRNPDGSLATSWAIQVARPPRIVATIPAEGTTGVPTDTGIEITFDQDGIGSADLEAAFSISPRVPGQFRAAGRTIAFVPARRLAPATLYTVTIRRGLAVAETGPATEEDTVVRFETAAGSAEPPVTVSFQRLLTDVATGERAEIGVYFAPRDWEAPFPRTLRVRVHELPGIEAALDAYRTLRLAPSWTRSGQAPIALDGLAEVIAGGVPLQRVDRSTVGWFRLPRTLRAGWYVVTAAVGGVARQSVLQVTDLATVAVMSTTRTAVWVNDLATGDPVAGAVLRLDGTAVGRTDEDGLRVAATPGPPGDGAPASPVPTPDPAAAGGPPLLVVADRRGRAMFLPVEAGRICAGCDWLDTNDRWWRVLATDRSQLRATDSINAWGVVRDRDTGRLPERVELRLLASGAPDDTGIASVPVPLAPSGAFTATLAYRDVPFGDYTVALVADGAIVSSTWVTVSAILKPAYALQLAVDRRATLAGDVVTATTSARFFDGTPVAGAELALGIDERRTVTARTDAGGTTAARVTMPSPDQLDWQWSEMWLQVNPTLPEEGQISGGVPLMVFRSTAVLEAQGSLEGRTLRVSGRLADVAFERYGTDGGDADRPLWEIDPFGRPRAGAAVRVEVTELVTTRRQVGTDYDFITKRTVPRYQYSYRPVPLGTRTVRTAGDGTFRLTRMVTGGDDRAYEIRARYVDAQGTRIDALVSAGRPPADPEDAQPRLVPLPDPGTELPRYSVGERIVYEFRGGHPSPARDRYLFLTAQRGIRTARLAAGPRFTTRFGADDVPSLTIQAVRFTGRAYELASSLAWFAEDDRRLRVELEPDRERYAPGDTVQLAVRVTTPAGRPAQASVILQAVDEKLYAAGGAQQTDALSALYAPVGSGLLAVASSHQPPTIQGEGGDTAGGDDGGVRTDFRDWLLFRALRTDTDGRARISFRLSDDLTSWRVSAAAVTRELEAGSASVAVPVGLPFFIEAALAPEYLVGEQPVVRVRGFGSALRAGDRVRFVVAARSAGLEPTTVEAGAFEAADVMLPPLPPGEHAVRIAASAGSGAGRVADGVVRTIRVVASRTTQRRVAAQLVGAGTTVPVGTGLTTLVLADASRGRVLPLLEALAASDRTRGDTALAAALARVLLRDPFGLPDSSIPEAGDELSRYQVAGGGIAVLPYGSPSLELSALAAQVADPRIDRGRLGDYLREVYTTDGQRERRLVALAGLAGLGEPVVPEVQEATIEPSLSLVERLWAGVALVAIGDLEAASALEREILATSGVEAGTWVRLEAGDREADLAATGLLAIVAAAAADPLSIAIDAYLDANRPDTTVLDLERALAASWTALRASAAPVVVAVTVDGRRRDVTLEAGRGSLLTLTPAQAATLRLDAVSGRALAVAGWEEPLDPASLRRPEGVSIERSLSPARVTATSLVTVSFTVRVPAEPRGMCWQVTDLVPSGLAPIAPWQAWSSPGQAPGQAPSGSVLLPWRIIGQRVDFCVAYDPREPVQELRYRARVVTPGRFRWEPAVLQSSVAPGDGIALPAFDLEVVSGR